MKHFGHIDRHEKMVRLDFWLIVHPGDPKVSEFNRRPGVRVTAGQSKLDRQERAINLKVALPIALFETPTLAASIKVEQPTQAVAIDVATIADAVRQVIGMDVDVAIQMPDEAE